MPRRDFALASRFLDLSAIISFLLSAFSARYFLNTCAEWCSTSSLNRVGRVPAGDTVGLHCAGSKLSMFLSFSLGCFTKRATNNRSSC